MPDEKGGEGSVQFIRQQQQRPRAQDHGPFKDMFQLPDVPGLRIILQDLHRLPWYGTNPDAQTPHSPTP
jgi:hypothetical protein